ncbi:hypothetical protein [Streptomyces sp. NPDC059819]|uniref:hypothetical protein n=1 Tax=Streptomyces sp. NPDC059819 TaxID=3346963 RepID=UPI00364B05C1
MAAAAPATCYEAEHLLHVVGRLAVWTDSGGLPRDPGVWLRTETIDAFVLSGCAGLDGSTVQTYRSWLRRVREALVWVERGEAPPARLSSPRDPQPPYEHGGLSRLRAWTGHLPGRARADGLALMALGAGCGLAPGEVVPVESSRQRVEAERRADKEEKRATDVQQRADEAARCAQEIYDRAAGELADERDARLRAELDKATAEQRATDEKNRAGQLNEQLGELTEQLAGARSELDARGQEVAELTGKNEELRKEIHRRADEDEEAGTKRPRRAKAKPGAEEPVTIHPAQSAIPLSDADADGPGEATGPADRQD